MNYKLDRQVAIIEEQETVINIQYHEKEVVVWSNRRVVMQKMLDRGYVPSDVEYEGDEIWGMSFRLPMEELTNFVKMNIFGYRPSKDTE